MSPVEEALENSNKYKQVIIMKKFPSLRTGKYIAQGAHASQLALRDAQEHYKDYYDVYLKTAITKIVVYVEDEKELRAIFDKAASTMKLPVSIIIDKGYTEFKGVPTYTAVAIGPAPSDLIDPITKHLPLF